jgi:hypothetical protein
MGYTTSTIHGIEVPDSSEANNVPEDIGKVVTALEGGSIIRRLTGAAIAALTAPQKPAGVVVYNTTIGKLMISDGTSFVDVDAAALASAALKLPLAGGTMSGAIAMGGSKVTGLGNGSASGDAVNKGQLDAVSTVANAAQPTDRVKTWVGSVSGGGTTVTLGTSPTGTWSVVASVRLSGSGDERIVRVTNVTATSCVLYVWDESYLGFVSATCSLIAMAA